MTDRIHATRTIAADPEAVFTALTDPDTHQHTEPGEWVGPAVDTEPLTGVGQIFAMNMKFPQNGEPYVMHNLVSAFVPDRTIAWIPGSKDDSTGAIEYGGWVWRYDLAASGDATEVTLTYDWADMPPAVQQELGIEFPPFPPDFLDQSLASLDRTVTQPAG